MNTLKLYSDSFIEPGSGSIQVVIGAVIAMVLYTNHEVVQYE